MKYLTKEGNPILEKKLFVVMRTYRLLKYEKFKIEQQIKNKPSFLETAEKDLVENLNRINNDPFAAPETKSNLTKDQITKHDALINNYEMQIGALPHKNEAIKQIILLLKILYKLKTKSCLDETEVSLLKHKTNFLDELVNQLTEISTEEHNAHAAVPIDISDQEIESLFSGEAQIKIKGSNCKKELIQNVIQIGIFSSIDQTQLIPSQALVQKVKAYLDDKAQLNEITRTYGLRDKVKEIKLQREAKQQETKVNEDFQNAYLCQ